MTEEKQYGNGWKRYLTAKVVPGYRTGWIGVWDSLVSAITKSPRTTVATEVTFSFFSKHENIRAEIIHAQVEESKK